MPLASDANEALLNVTDEVGCHTTGVFGSGMPEASSTRAVNATGRTAPAAPV
jgi:hypothetical protein